MSAVHVVSDSLVDPSYIFSRDDIQHSPLVGDYSSLQSVLVGPSKAKLADAASQGKVEARQAGDKQAAIGFLVLSQS
jgi:hypothetical protein